ncbi:AFG1/ZapE family ATPase, partial [Yersinia frederiksenii]
MQPSSPIALYQQALDAGDYQPDDVQRRTVTRLDTLYQELNQRQNTPPARAGLRRRLGRLLGRSTPRTLIHPAQGLYMWGGVGRGKTWLMDMFFHSLPGERKLRLHFHR